jgi:transglutaminase-like putative cysteine protease
MDSGQLSEVSRRRVRLLTFSALALYGALRWGTLLNPAPSGRLLGLAALSMAIAAGIPAARRYGRLVALAPAVVLCLLALPMAGLQWHSFIHLRIAVSARQVGDGLAGLPSAFVPYAGTSAAVRLVIMLGAAILLLDAAIVIAFAPEGFGDARRAGAALPLIALAVVPSTLVRPQFPYLQGLVLFVLLAAFMWGERIRREAAGTAIWLAALVGVAAALVAPRLDQHKPWLDYRAWTAEIARHVDTFDWNQTYGPLNWPHSGHQVFAVSARTADYWKAENLDLFDGYGWVLGSASGHANLPQPSRAARAAWTQRIKVTIRGMRTSDVIASGEAVQAPAVEGGVQPGVDYGRFTADRTLGPGTSYTVTTYSPQPTATQLRGAGSDYPFLDLRDDLTLTIPQRRTPPAEFTWITFSPFHALAGASREARASSPRIAAVMRASPYAAAYALAQHLARESATASAFVENVLHYLSHGYRYNQKPPLTTYPLLTFLFNSRVGYCQQFSGAMALLLRMGGVPARVAAGFTSGNREGASGPFLVSDIDAHAWVEVWFPQYGWVRFDPTPAVAPARRSITPAANLKNLVTGGANSSGTSSVRRHAATGTASAPHPNSSGGVTPLLILPALAALAALALVGLLVRNLARPTPTIEDLLDELERAMARTGRPLGGGITLAALEHRFRGSPGASGYIRSLRLGRYGVAGPAPARAGRRALRLELCRDLGLAGRLRALWAMPPRLRPALARTRQSPTPEARREGS